MTYYNKDEKLKILKSYLGNLYIPYKEIPKKTYQLIKNRIQTINTPCSKLIIYKDIKYLKLIASMILISNLRYPDFKVIDIDSLMNTWLGYDTGESKETIKSIDTLIILSFGASFFKNIQGLLQSVILKRQFDGYNTLVLSIQKDKNLTSCFESKDILEFRGK